jgi:hypothetical protein
MLYPEFGQYKSFVEPGNILIHGYTTANGHTFYVEPGFYDQLMGFKDKRYDSFPKILEAIYAFVEKNDKVIFTVNFETPFFHKDGYIYQEIEDITNPLSIFFEDKSRGSDYGD